MSLKIKRTTKFTKSFKKLYKIYKKISDDYDVLLTELELKGLHTSVNLGDNFYKIRLQNSANNKGKSAGFRVVYFYQTTDNEIYLLDIYTKSQVATIDKKQLITIAQKLQLL